MSKSIMHYKGSSCYVCDQTGGRMHHNYLEEHHCFGGANRQLSEHYGLKVYLCPEHHRTGKYAVHINKYTAMHLHEDAQRAFEEHYPNENFREIFGKNYL